MSFRKFHHRGVAAPDPCYAGMLEALAAQHEVISIEQIDYEGEYAQNAVRLYFFFRRPSAGVWFPFRLHRLIRDLNGPGADPGFAFPGPGSPTAARPGIRHEANCFSITPNCHSGVWANGPSGSRIVAPTDIVRLQANGPSTGSNKATWLRQKNSPGNEVSSVFYPVDRRFAREKTGASGEPVFLWSAVECKQRPAKGIKGLAALSPLAPGRGCI